MDEARYREAEQRLWAWVGATPTERRVQLGHSGITVRIQELGDGAPVLFVHGGAVSGASWATLTAYMAGFRCILLDRPGTGLSDPFTTRMDADQLASVADSLIVDVLDALGIGSAHLVATSYGGYFALRAAAAHPSRIGRMVQFSWPVGAPIARVPTQMRLAALPFAAWVMSSMPINQRMARRMFRQIGHAESVESGRIPPEMIDWWVALLRHTDTMRNETRMGRGFFSLRRGLNDRLLLSDDFLKSVQTPTWFIWGEHDPFGGRATAQWLVDRMPNAGFEVFAGAGHAPWFDDIGGAAARVTSFLQARRPRPQDGAATSTS